MVAGAFPIAKLAYLAMKQISKPIANSMKSYAKHNTFFRNHVCLPPAQFYHWAETTTKMYLMGLGKPTKVAPLNEQMAVELGAELLGETIVFLIAAGTIYLEYSRQTKNSKAKEDVLAARLDSLEEKVGILINLCEQQDQRVREMNKHLHSNLYKNMKEKFSSKKYDDEIESEFRKLGRSLEADKRRLMEEAEEAEKRAKKKSGGDHEENEDENQQNLSGSKTDQHHVTPTTAKQTGIKDYHQKRVQMKNFGQQNDLIGLNFFQRLINEASNLILGEDKVAPPQRAAQNPNPAPTAALPGSGPAPSASSAGEKR